MKRHPATIRRWCPVKRRIESVVWAFYLYLLRSLPWRRTHRSRARLNRRTWGALLRCRKSADSIIVTSAAPHGAICGASHPHWPVPLRGPINCHRGRAREPIGIAARGLSADDTGRVKSKGRGSRPIRR